MRKCRRHSRGREKEIATQTPASPGYPARARLQSPVGARKRSSTHREWPYLRPLLLPDYLNTPRAVLDDEGSRANLAGFVIGLARQIAASAHGTLQEAAGLAVHLPHLVHLLTVPDLVHRLALGVPDHFMIFLVIRTLHHEAIGSNDQALILLRTREFFQILDIRVLPEIIYERIEGHQIDVRREGFVVLPRVGFLDGRPDALHLDHRPMQAVLVLVLLDVLDLLQDVCKFDGFADPLVRVARAVDRDSDPVDSRLLNLAKEIQRQTPTVGERRDFLDSVFLGIADGFDERGMNRRLSAQRQANRRYLAADFVDDLLEHVDVHDLGIDVLAELRRDRVAHRTAQIADRGKLEVN